MRNIKSKALLTLALIGYLAMARTTSGWFLLFLWAIPLFYRALNQGPASWETTSWETTSWETTSWFAGALWSTIAMGVQSGGLLWGLYALAQGPYLYRLI